MSETGRSEALPMQGSGDETLLFTGAAFNTVAMDAPVFAPVDVQQIAGLDAINPLVAAANPLLLMVPTLRRPQPPGNVNVTRSRLIGLLRDFDNAARSLGVPDDQRNIARYALCTLVDEAILHTPWGTQAEWAQQSLLLNAFDEASGGEKFFQMLAKMSAEPARFMHLLEMFYVCLALGYMGHYRALGSRGREAVLEARERLHALVHRAPVEEGGALSAHWQGVDVEPLRFKGFGTLGVVAAVCALAGLVVFAWYSHALAARVDALALSGLALPKAGVNQVALAPAAKPRLAQLLAPEIQAGHVSVKDLRLESVVSILGETVFESGSAAPTPRARQLLGRIAAALDQVDGQIVVTGHTDNVPTRTLRHASNFALSKERAAHVQGLIAGALKDGARISAEGKGETEPVAPNTTPEGRAQNRRVDITLRVPATLQAGVKP